jgi:hypothetical protein
MKRGQWYALAAPLNKMVTGDFSFGGYPNMWQKEFIRSNTTLNDFTGNWEDPSEVNTQELGSNLHYAISVWAGEYLSGTRGEDTKYHANLNALKGIVEIPYFENSSISNLHRIHSYDGVASSFKYYQLEKDDYPFDDKTPGTITRGNEAYRFIFDGKMTTEVVNGISTQVFKMTVPAGQELMIGNPFISTFDFRKFYELNQAKIDPYYRLFVNNGWHSYSYAAGAGQLDKDITSLQAFFISTIGSGNTELYFPPEFVSITRTQDKEHQLKSSAQNHVFEDVLYINAKNSEGESWVTLALNEPARENILKLFSPNYPLIPELYVLDDRNNKNEVQYESNYDVDINLGIASKDNGNIEMTFKNLEALNTNSLILVDKLLNKEINVLEETSYSFINKPDENNCRFTLKVGSNRAGTGIEAGSAARTSIYASGKTVSVRSESPIKQVTVTNTQGMEIVSDIVDAKRDYSRKLQVNEGIYIVKAKTENGETHIQKVIIKE